jgi:hypothetical protein
MLQPGGTFAFLPEHTWAMGITYARGRTTVGLNVTGTGLVQTGQDALSVKGLSGEQRLQQDIFNTEGPRYVPHDNGYAIADLTVSHRFATQVEGVLQVQNLTNNYTNDFGAGIATVGRTAKAGLRIRL